MVHFGNLSKWDFKDKTGNLAKREFKSQSAKLWQKGI